MAGSLLWLLALVALAFIVDQGNAVELALLILAVSFGAGLLLAGALRMQRTRNEGAA